MAFSRWWSRLAGAPARGLMAILSRRVPHQEYDGIRLVVADSWLDPRAERFFARTEEALAAAASGAPRAYAALRQDVEQIVLTLQTNAPPYQRFQLAAVAPVRVALEADIQQYAVWLLHTSAYMHGEQDARARSEEFLESLEPEQRADVSAWLAEEHERSIGWKEV